MRITGPALLLAVLVTTGAAEDFKATKIHGFGNKGNRINIVIFGDGWSQADLDSGTYEEACKRLKDGILAEEPFKTYANFLTITRVDVPSPRSGVTHEYVWLGETQTPGSGTGAGTTGSTGGGASGATGGSGASGGTSGSTGSTGSAGSTGSTASTSPTVPATWSGLEIVASTPTRWVDPDSDRVYRPGPIIGSYYDTWYYASRRKWCEAGSAIVSVDRSIWYREDCTKRDDFLKKVAETNKDIPRNVTCLLINDASPGGAANSGIFTCANEPGSAKTMAHELGHALAMLADEYVEWGNERPASTIPAEANLKANVTRVNDPATVKWKIWFPTGSNPTAHKCKPSASSSGTSPACSQLGLGLHEGALYRSTGVYRPKDNCMMREHWAAPFCEICQEESIRRFYMTVSLIDAVDPAPQRLSLETGASQSFKVYCIGGQENKIKGEWHLGSKVMTTGTKTDRSQGPLFELDLGPEQLVAGQHEIRFVAKDETPLVKDAKESNPAYRRRPNLRRWYVTVREPSGMPGLKPGASTE